MTWLAHIAMIGWLPAVFVLSGLTRVRHRAVILVYMIAWLFLPMTGYALPGLPDYDKMVATSLGALLAAAAFDPHRLLSFRPRWFDVPVLFVCLAPFATSISNDLGAYDGLSAIYEQTVRWGIPYFLGRLYFSDPVALRDLAVALVLGGIVYVPLCLFEMRMAPQLHEWVYGVNVQQTQHFMNFNAFGPFGWKPVVFTSHTFALAMFMATATLSAFWLWRSGVLRQVFGVPMWLVFAALCAVTIGCKIWTAAGLMMVGIGVLAATEWSPRRICVVVLLLVAPLYMAVRGPGLWSGEPIQTIAGAIWEQKAENFQVRLDNEDELVDKAMRRPWLGWGRWGRMRIYDEQGRNQSLTDGLWVITLGRYGLVGLISFTIMMLVPVAAFVRRFPPQYWRQPMVAPAMVLGLALTLHMIDNLLNAFPNPIFPMIAGSLVPLRPGWRGGSVRQPRRHVSHGRGEAVEAHPAVSTFSRTSRTL